VDDRNIASPGFSSEYSTQQKEIKTMKKYIIIDCEDNITEFSTLEEVKNFLLWTITMEAWEKNLCQKEHTNIVIDIAEFFASGFDATKTPYLFDAYLSDFYSIYEKRV